MTDLKVVVRCVSAEQTPSAPLIEAFEAMKNLAEEVVWFSEKECLAVNTKQNEVIYVFERFEEKEPFNHLSRLGCRIYGPICILNCLKSNKSLPKLPHPVHSLTMEDLIVCCSSIEAAQRAELYKKVSWMCGRGMRNFDDQVSHLVCGEVGSKKYQVAASLKKKLVTPEWVEHLWVKSQSSFVRGDDPQYEARFRCPVFKGLVITVSGIPDRDRVRADIEREGGRYTGDMKLKECTHLIVSEPRGQKYEVAMKWKINIITPQWVEDSLKAGFCMQESKYSINVDRDDRPKTTSTPTGQHTGGLGDTLLHNISSISALNVNETTLAGDVTNISAGLLRKSSISLQANARREEPFSLPDNLDAFLDGCKVALCGFHGPQLELLRKIVNLGGGIRLNDLTDNVTHVVTNKENIASVAKQLEENGWRPHVTGAEWLVDCAKSNEHKSELPYLLYQYKPLAKQGKESIVIIRSEGHEAGLKMQDLQANARKRKSDDNISKDILTLNRGEENETSKKRFQSSSSLVRSDSVLVPRGIDEVVDMETMMSQYLPTNIPTNYALSVRNPVQSLGDMGDSTIMAALGEIAQPVEVSKKLEHAVDDGNDDTISNDKDETKGNNRDVTIADVVDVEMQDEESKLIFKQKTFIMSGFSPEEEADLENEIIECGGQMFVEKSGKGRQRKADYGMVPIICDIQQLPAKEIVTNAWMIMCLEVEKLLPVSGNPIFRPFNIKSGLTCLQGCVLSISGISGVEREALVTLAEALGARYQEYFVHKRVRDLEISTHLIAKEPSGTKYDAAVKWNLPIVSKMWLLECAKEQAHVPEKNFLISSNEHLNESMSKSKVDQPQINVVEVARVEENSVKESVAQKLGTPYKITSTSIAEKVLNNSLTRSVGGASSVASVVGVTTASVLSSEPRPSELIGATSDKPGKSNEIPVLNLTAVTNDLRPEMATGGTPSASPRQVFRKGLRSKFDVALFQDALQHLDSTAGAKRKSSIGLDVLMESGLRKAIATTSLPMKGTPQPERNNVTQVQKPILHGVVIAVAKKLCAQQSELNAIALQLGADYRWTFDFSCTHFIFQGKTNDTNKEFRVAVEQGKKIVSPHWLYACKEENSRKDEAAYPHTFNPNMALSVISTPARVSTRNSRQKAKESAASAAKESTADAAKESAASAAKESAAGATKESAAGTAKAGETNRVKESRPLQSETLKNAEQRVTPSKEDCVEKINSLLETAKARSLRRPSKFVAEKVTTPSGTVAGELSTKSQAVTVVSDMNSRSLRSTRLASVITIESQEVPSETQIGEVVWEDAAARAQQQRLATEHFAAAAESVEESERPVLPLGESIDPLDKVDAILQARHKPVQQKSSSVHNTVSSPLKAPPAGPPVLRTIQPVVTPIVCKKEIEPPVTRVLPQKLVFLFSGMTPQERDLYGALVEQLGGIVSDNQGYDPRCTHLAAGTVVRNEKFLASLAAGKWVMHKSFFEASRECGKFVEESQHEWGGPASMMSLASMGPQVSRMAISAKKWRMKIAETRKIKPSYGGAFDGWQVVLLVDKKKEESFRRLLEAGGAVVHVVKVNAEKWKDISHAFVEPAKLPNEVNYMKAMLSAGVPCLKPEYLAAYLLDEPEPLQNQFLAFPPSL